MKTGSWIVSGNEGKLIGGMAAMKRNVDLFLFMGQSNMAGRGIPDGENGEKAPVILPGAGYEYRAVSAPDHLFFMEEPFGKEENRKDGIDDGDKKTGSLATAFINAYYLCTRIPVIAISASKGGSSILEWQAGGSFLEDAKKRLRSGRKYLLEKGFYIRHIFMLWCQGETDGDRVMEPEEYRLYFERMLAEMKETGTEKCFLIRIGEYNGEEAANYDKIIEVQTQIPKENADVVLVSTDFAEMKKRGGMKDWYHYYQWAYNEAGLKAGMNAGSYVNTGREPVLYDPYYKNLYFSSYDVPDLA